MTSLSNKDNFNLEDHRGYYEALGCTKTSSDDEINKQYQRLRKKFHAKSLQYHPDKNINKSKEEQAIAKSNHWKYQDQWDKQTRAFK